MSGIFDRPECYAAWVGSKLLTVRDFVISPIVMGEAVQVDLDCLTHDDGTDRLFRNVLVDPRR